VATASILLCFNRTQQLASCTLKKNTHWLFLVCISKNIRFSLHWIIMCLRPNKTTLFALMVAFAFLLVTGRAHAGYLVNSNCYPTTADALQAFNATYPYEDTGRIYYQSSAATITAGGLISTVIASKSMTASTVTAGVANTYQLTVCSAAAVGSDQQVLTAIYGQQASMVVYASSAESADVLSNQQLSSILAAASSISASTAIIASTVKPSSTTADYMSVQSVIILVAALSLGFVGFNAGKGRH
jgi:hypothetical protein